MPISPRELRRMLADPNVEEQQIQQYITLDRENSSAFAPRFRANPDSVDTQNMDAGGLLGSLNTISRQRRRRRYREKIAAGFNGIKIVSEGDSWFQFPVLLRDVVDQLFDDPNLAIFSLDAAGDLLENMIQVNEFTPAIIQEKPDIFLISGGGNDTVADGRLETLLHPFNNSFRAEDYLNKNFDDFVDEIMKLYRELFNNLSNQFDTLKIICHGYDYVIPRNFISLGMPMSRLQISDRDLQQDIMKVIIDRLNNAQIDLVSQFNRVYHVDCRDAVNSNNWFDELHPNNSGFDAVAERFRSVING
jgi:lysophospholipase L1-like esterase